MRRSAIHKSVGSEPPYVADDRLLLRGVGNACTSDRVS